MGVFGNIPVNENITGAFYSSQEDGICDKMLAVISAEDAGKLKEGMEVQVSPSTASRDSYGYIVGEIESISQYPVSQEDVEAILHNQQLTEMILPSGVGIQVVIQLERDSATESGLLWSSEKGGGAALKKGITGTAMIILKNQKPIELILED